MKISEKYNKIINEIEYSVRNEYADLTAKEQLEKIAQNNGYPSSDLRYFNTAFQFLTETLPWDYIKRRRLMYAYEVLINQEVYEVEKAILIAGYDNQNSFTKKFRSEFDITPRQAWKKKNKELLQSPMFWDVLEGVDMNMDNVANVIEPEQTILGIDVKIYDKFVEFQNMCTTYGVRAEQGESAYAIAEKYDLDLDKAFDYVSNYPFVTKEMFIKNGYEYYYGDPDEGETPITADEFDPKAYYMEMIDDEEMIYCCISCGLSHDEACEALGRLSLARYTYDPLKCSVAFLYACAHSDSVVEHLDRAASYYLAHLDEAFDYERFDYYLYLLDCNVPVETAFEEAMIHITDSEEEEYVKDLLAGKYTDSYIPSKEEYFDAIFDEMEERRSNW